MEGLCNRFKKSISNLLFQGGKTFLPDQCNKKPETPSIDPFTNPKSPFSAFKCWEIVAEA